MLLQAQHDEMNSLLHRTELNSAQALKRNRLRRSQILVARGGVSETNGTPGNAMTTPQNRRGDWFVGDYE